MRIAAPRAGSVSRKRPARAGEPGQWWEIPARFQRQRCVLRLFEKPDVGVPELLQRVRSGDYARPFVLDDGAIRRLHFGLRYVQSEMILEDPDALSLAYTRAMMACLLFQPQPQKILIVGLGGGSLTKFCHRQLPGSRTTSIEIDPLVIEMGRLFEIPPPDSRLRVVQADAVEFLARTHERFDLILLDGCDSQGVAGAFCEEGFYRRLRTRLRPGGVVAVNLIGPAAAMRRLRALIAEVFGQKLIVLDVDNGRNRIAFAFCGPGFPPDWPALKRRAAGLQRRHGLDFLDYAVSLQRSFLART